MAPRFRFALKLAFVTVVSLPHLQRHTDVLLRCHALETKGPGLMTVSHPHTVPGSIVFAVDL